MEGTSAACMVNSVGGENGIINFSMDKTTYEKKRTTLKKQRNLS
jgi:hypothetical protein